MCWGNPIPTGCCLLCGVQFRQQKKNNGLLLVAASRGYLADVSWELPTSSSDVFPVLLPNVITMHALPP